MNEKTGPSTEGETRLEPGHLLRRLCFQARSPCCSERKGPGIMTPLEGAASSHGMATHASTGDPQEQGLLMWWSRP